MKLHNILWFTITSTFLAITSCDTAPVVEPPLPPSPIRDCSYDFTITAIDSIGLPPSNPNGAINTQYDYYERFSINDMCFDPNNPNKLALAIGLDDHPSFNSSVESVVIIIDICSNASTIIYEMTFREVVGLDWGHDGRLILSTSSNQNHIVIINSDGTGQSSFQLEQWKYGDIEWAADQQSFYLSPSYSVIASHFDLNGNFINDDLEIRASGFRVSDSMMYYIDYFGVHSLNLNTGATLLEDQHGFNGNAKWDLDYSENTRSVVWCTDSIVATTDLENGLRNELLLNGDVHRWNREVAVSSIGTIAYTSNVLSLALSNATVWKYRTELRFINFDGTEERRLVLDFQ